MTRRFVIGILLLLLPVPAFATWTTGTVTLIQKTQTGLRVQVVLTGDMGEKADPPLDLYVSSLTDLEQQVAAALTKLNGVSADIGKITVGMVVPPVPATGTPPGPTPEQQFFADLIQLASVSKALGFGIFDASDPTYAALLKKVQQEFQTRYVNDPGWPLR